MHRLGLLWYFGDPLAALRPIPPRHRNDPEGGQPRPERWAGPFAPREEGPRRRRIP
jgi:hypothetical protein